MATKKNFVVIMMGYTGSGKSTIAKMLAEKIGADVFHSAVIRRELGYKFTKEEAANDFFLMTSKKREPMDKAVYSILSQKAKDSLRNKKDVIVDAGHFFKWQRKNLYRDLRKFAPDFFILMTECSESNILERLKDRENKFFDSEFNETPSVKAYYSSKKVIEFPDNDFFNGIAPIIIKYNTETCTVNIEKKIKNKNLVRILKVLK
ncbi:AAA family ATPase [Candidatus Pacearchaeota archaeon]|nr:AAA family ATPase [Candidatus Pacearchaeota archaeon]